MSEADLVSRMKKLGFRDPLPFRDSTYPKDALTGELAISIRPGIVYRGSRATDKIGPPAPRPRPMPSTNQPGEVSSPVLHSEDKPWEGPMSDTIGILDLQRKEQLRKEIAGLNEAVESVIAILGSSGIELDKEQVNDALHKIRLDRDSRQKESDELEESSSLFPAPNIVFNPQVDPLPKKPMEPTFGIAELNNRIKTFFPYQLTKLLHWTFRCASCKTVQNDAYTLPCCTKSICASCYEAQDFPMTCPLCKHTLFNVGHLRTAPHLSLWADLPQRRIFHVDIAGPHHHPGKRKATTPYLPWAS